MEGIFALPYSEYEAILQIQKFFKKYDDFAVLVPTSRQQKGIDFLILNTLNSKTLRVQVKSSRSYVHATPAVNPRVEHFVYHFWFNNFFKRYKSNVADVYLLFGLYPIYTTGHSIKSKKRFWKNVILAFTDKEMHGLLSQVRTKKKRKRDRFFSISFNETDKIVGNRGFLDQPDLTKYVLKNRVSHFLKKLK
jgi:hypothetical protein